MLYSSNNSLCFSLHGCNLRLGLQASCTSRGLQSSTFGKINALTLVLLLSLLVLPLHELCQESIMEVFFWQAVGIKDLLGIACAMRIKLKMLHCMAEKVRISICPRFAQLIIDVSALISLYRKIVSHSLLHVALVSSGTWHKSSTTLACRCSHLVCS